MCAHPRQNPRVSCTCTAVSHMCAWRAHFHSLAFPCLLGVATHFSYSLHSSVFDYEARTLLIHFFLSS